MKERYAHSLFCDDVRFEQGNKQSYMGVYDQDLIVVGTPPLQLPKLAITVWACTPIARPFAHLAVRIEHPSGDPFRHEFGDLFEAEDKKSEGDSQMFRALCIFSPFPISSEGRMKVRVETESEELKAGTLNIKFVDSDNRNKE